MSRLILLSVLLLIGATAHGMNPARQGPNGSASCPETQLAVEAEEDDAASAAATAQGAAPATGAGPGPVVAKPAATTRPKTGARWHSFLPGMFK